MSDKVPFTTRALGMLSAYGIRAWMRTQSYQSFFYDPSVDPRFGRDKPRIYLFWHEYILVPLYLRPHCDIVMLLSRHKDAEILAQVAKHVGFGCVRGSSNKGAASALLEMKRHGKQSHIAITPDGPRGPRREMALGAIYLASQSGMPIVPMGFGMAKPKRMKSWDQFAMPRLFGQIRCVVGPPTYIQPDLSREDLEVARLHVQGLMNDLTDEAEDWAASGVEREGANNPERRRTRIVKQKSTEESQHTIAPQTQRRSA